MGSRFRVISFLLDTHILVWWRLDFTKLSRAQASHPLLSIFPLTPEIAADSVRLGDNFPGDSADQMIAATARHHGLKLLTSDERIRKSGKVAVV